SHMRLFNRKFARYGKREIHEELDIKGNTESLKNDIVHLTYDSYDFYLRKVKKYASLEAKVYDVRPKPWLGLSEFLFRYIKLRGYKDGFAGLISALFLGYYKFLLFYYFKK